MGGRSRSSSYDLRHEHRSLLHSSLSWHLALKSSDLSIEIRPISDKVNIYRPLPVFICFQP
jgi:hypothetical protein